MHKDISKLVVDSGFFNEKWYVEHYPDVAASGSAPLEHYLRLGSKLGRRPGPDFSPEDYLAANPDLAKAKVEALVHYLRYGRNEGRRLSPAPPPPPPPKKAALAPVAPPAVTGKPSVPGLKTCVVFHAYHPDLIVPVADRIRATKLQPDLIVTTSHDPTRPEIAALRERFPNLRIVPHANQGRDVFPFISVLESLKDYDLCCKIHTKRGLTNFGDLWREVCLDALVGSPELVEKIIGFFKEHPDLLMAGPRIMYKSTKAMMFGNRAGLESLLKFLGAPHTPDTEWGFFAGTMFWMRPAAFQQLAAIARLFPGIKSESVNDGNLEHSIERIFGWVPFARSSKVLLVDTHTGDQPAFELVQSPGQPDSVLPTKTLERLQGVLHRKNKIRGHLDKNTREEPFLRGWVACLGDKTPCTATIIIDGTHRHEVLCSNYRADLKAASVNDGEHAFEFMVPIHLQDGQKHVVELRESTTSRTIGSREYVFGKPKTFPTFAQFLADSLVTPLVLMPLNESAKKCAATMENIAKWLAARGDSEGMGILVSVIMPVYNRITTIAKAIDSVFGQTHANLELIVVDDGSTDGTTEYLEGLADPRVVLIKNLENKGVCRSRNRGLYVARGEIIAYLDSDNTWDERYLAAMTGAFLTRPDADAVFGGQLLFRGAETKPFGFRYGAVNRSLMANNNYVDLNAFCHKRDVVARVGGFDESLRRYVDWELILRMAESAKVYSVPVLLSHYCYDKAANTITNNQALSGDMDAVRDRRPSCHQMARVLETMRSAAPPACVAPAPGRHKVSIVIPSFEALDDIKECLETIRLLGLQDWVNVIVADNASTPPVVEFLDGMAARGEITFIRNDTNYGFTYAVSQGIAAAPPDADILILNNDAMLTPGAIEALQDKAYALPDCAMTVPRQVLPAGTHTMNVHVPYANPAYDCDVNLSAHHANVINLPVFHDGEVTELNFAPFFCVYIRRDVLDESVGLDSEFGRHYRSDRIFCDFVRHAMGKRIYHVSAAVVYHKLQRATEQLKTKKAGGNTSFDTMFQKNQWEERLAMQLGFRTAIWDF